MSRRCEGHVNRVSVCRSDRVGMCGAHGSVEDVESARRRLRPQCGTDRATPQPRAFARGRGRETPLVRGAGGRGAESRDSPRTERSALTWRLRRRARPRDTHNGRRGTTPTRIRAKFAVIFAPRYSQMFATETDSRKFSTRFGLRAYSRRVRESSRRIRDRFVQVRASSRKSATHSRIRDAFADSRRIRGFAGSGIAQVRASSRKFAT
eukprot:1230264-Prymnesium_polylepis.2